MVTQFRMRFELQQYYYKGEIKSLSAWAAEYGIDQKVLRHRLTAMGMSLHEALNVQPYRETCAYLCRGCPYQRRLYWRNTPCFCAYILITGKRRPWSFAKCPYRQKRKENKT